MKNILGSVVLVACQFAFAQSTRNVGEFSSLKVYNKINVVLVQSNESRVETENNDPDIETINKNGELKIKLSPAKILSGEQVSVKVFYEKLNDIQASQGSSVSSSDELDANMLSLTSNEGSRINLNIDTSKLNIKTNSGGEIKISGTADNQDVIVNSGGKYFGKEVDSQNTTVTANAGGMAEVNVSDSVNATTRAGGIIEVYGDPAERKVKNI
ncbi:MAG: head GIN domain-containing protein, partial [Kaistella sp.]